MNINFQRTFFKSSSKIFFYKVWKARKSKCHIGARIFKLTLIWIVTIGCQWLVLKQLNPRHNAQFSLLILRKIRRDTIWTCWHFIEVIELVCLFIMKALPDLTWWFLKRDQSGFFIKIYCKSMNTVLSRK